MKYVEPDSSVHKSLKEYIQTSWNSYDPNIFPGPQPISIERKHYVALRRQPYVVCEKTDGIRHMLVCFEHEGKKLCLLVDRAFHAMYTTLTVPRDTILDGELLDNEFLVYDAIRVKGEDVRTLNLLERLEKARGVVKSILKLPSLRVTVKTMTPLENIQSIVLTEKSDGLIFTPINEPVRIGTHETLFKWKPRHLITIDFCVMNGKDLCIQERGIGLRKQAELCTGEDYMDGVIVECDYREHGWTPVKVRMDKTYPNNRRTFDRTIVNLRENIQLEEFYTVLHKKR